MKAPSWAFGIGVALLLVAVACGTYSSTQDGADDPQGVAAEPTRPAVPELEEPIDPAPCFAPARDDYQRHGGAFELAELPRLEPHVDIVELIVVGTIVERELIVNQPWWFDDNLLAGEQPRGGPLPIVNCHARYTVQVSEALKNDGRGELPSTVSVVALEREAHFLDGAVLELLPPLSPGEEVVLFLLRGGLGIAAYSVFGPRFIVEEGVVIPAGDYPGYTDEFDGASLDDLLSRIRLRVAEVPEARPFNEVTEEVLEELLHPTPAS